MRATIRSHAVIETRTNWDISVLKIGIGDDALRAGYSAGLRIWCEFGLSESDVKFLGVGNHLSQLKEVSICLRSNISLLRLPMVLLGEVMRVQFLFS